MLGLNELIHVKELAKHCRAVDIKIMVAISIIFILVIAILTVGELVSKAT